MNYLLDTNVAVDYLRGRHASVVKRLRTLQPDEVNISAIAVAELRYGADKSKKPVENHRLLDLFLADVATLNFDPGAALAYGKIRATLEAAGTPIGPNDMLIAAQAISGRLILVSDNVAEFRRIPDLEVQNWRTE